MPGTLIATPDGARPIETLRVGDLVLTVEGRAAPIRWIGRRRVDIAAHPRPDLVQPVRIAAHAFGDNRPARDLVLSPGHGVLFEPTPDRQVLIPAGELVDGGTIVRLARSSVDYLHLELDRHDIVLAEGLATESYLDTGNRADFGGTAALTLHPTFAAMAHEMACRPFVLVGPEVEAARARLSERAEAAGGEAGVRRDLTG